MQSLELLCTLKAQSQNSSQMSVSLFGLGAPQGQAPKRDRPTPWKGWRGLSHALINRAPGPRSPLPLEPEGQILTPQPICHPRPTSLRKRVPLPGSEQR